MEPGEGTFPGYVFVDNTQGCVGEALPTNSKNSEASVLGLAAQELFPSFHFKPEQFQSPPIMISALGCSAERSL